MSLAHVSLFLLLAPHLRAAPPPVVLGPMPQDGRILTMADGTWHSYWVREEGGRHSLARAVSKDRGRAWSAAEILTDLPESGWGGLLALRDRNGEMQFVLTRLRGEGKRIAIDRFIDLWHVRSTGGQKQWSAPRRIFEGYVGSIQQMLQLRSGRILMPFAAWIAGRPAAPPSGPNETTAVYSDDHGKTWTLSGSRLTAPVSEGYNGSNYGAVEPAILERRDGSVWMLMRTQTGWFYESTSRDGAEWTPAKQSGIRASSGPPFLLRLPDGRVVLFWNHCEMPPRVDGQGVYGGRDALHAAISSDEGKTWRGFREVYRDPFRHDTPPRSGDRGTAYPYAAATPDGKIALLSGQGAKRRALVTIDPDWLLETSASSRLPGDIGQWTWFLGTGPAKGWWRDRRAGAAPAPDPSNPSRTVLRIDAAATWNFPMGRAGVITIDLRDASGEVALAHRFFDPDDENGGRLALCRVPIPAMRAGLWHKLRLEWDRTGACRVSLDGRAAGHAARNQAADGAASYLRLLGKMYVAGVDVRVNP